MMMMMMTMTAPEMDAAIKELKAAVRELKGDMTSLEKSSRDVVKNIGDSKNLMGDAVKSMKSITIEAAKFSVNLQAQYKLAEELAVHSKQTAVNIGLAVGRSQEFTKSFNEAASQLAKFGGDARDVSNIMGRFASESGRARIITAEEVKNIYLLEKGLNVSDENAADLLEKMDLMGMNAGKANQQITDMVISSQKLGLNAGKVANVLADNFKSMQAYSFAGGVKGMTKMAEQAVKMRTDVSSMLGMAEKFYEPEAAIEAVANLQMLGGDVAKAFGDPFEIMYLARNKPEELAERVQDMTKNMLQFNDATGEYDLPAEARMQLKSVGDQLGMNVDQMVEIARQSSKISDIKMNVSGNILDKDMREGIASMAKMDKDGNWVVDLAGQGEVPIGDIGLDEAEKLLAAPKDSDEAIMDMAYNSMTTNEILDNILDAIKKGYISKSNVYELIEDAMRPSMEEAFKGIEGNITKMSEAAKQSPAGDVQKMLREQITNMGISGGELGKQFFDGVSVEIGAWLDKDENKLDWSKMFEESKNWKKILGKTPGPAEEDNSTPPPADPDGDFLSRPGGHTSFSSQDDVIGMKNGGPVDRLLQSAGIGRNPNIEQGIVNNNSMVKIDPITINGRIELVSPTGEIKGIDMDKIKSVIEPIIINAINQSSRNGGVLSSKEMVDRGI